MNIEEKFSKKIEVLHKNKKIEVEDKIDLLIKLSNSVNRCSYQQKLANRLIHFLKKELEFEKKIISEITISEYCEDKDNFNDEVIGKLLICKNFKKYIIKNRIKISQLIIITDLFIKETEINLEEFEDYPKLEEEMGIFAPVYLDRLKRLYRIRGDLQSFKGIYE